jgi:hypothetical protein
MPGRRAPLRLPGTSYVKDAFPRPGRAFSLLSRGAPRITVLLCFNGDFELRRFRRLVVFSASFGSIR